MVLPRRGGLRLQSAVLLAVLASLFFALSVDASHSHHQHHHHHHHLNHARGDKAVVRRGDGETGAKFAFNSTTGNSTDSGDAAEMVRNALEAMRVLNKQRLDHPRFNQEKFDPKPGAPEELAPSLPYDSVENGTYIRKRQAAGNSTTESSTYSIPDELAEAARIIAESIDQTPIGDHAEKAAELRAKHNRQVNDTNMPPQALVEPNGLTSYVPDDTPILTDNGTIPELSKRQSSQSFWMADIAKRGASPYAPAGYQVWRNVKDFGAKGDGKTDDTAAINKAISDGGRCGANCGSSTIVPAVIYFPPGTYLVSSSIIQYYNTQFLGNPFDVPTILAASSFVGLGVITSNKYISEQDEWYINTNNFLRSVRNFKIDIRNTDPTAYICGIHWQVAQASSLENIDFYMLYNKDYPQNTQQGIYMENGSGGFLSDLVFVGGKFGAYFGNQQFTTHQLIFWLCDTALQIHWDWAWTMQDVLIESCLTQGIVIVGGEANGPGSTGQGVGSFILVDASINNTPKGIVTTLFKENSTSLLLQNVAFNNVPIAVTEKSQGRTLLAGNSTGTVAKDNWGFGKITNGTASSTFANGADIPIMNRTTDLLSDTVKAYKPNLFTRRRPKYDDIGMAQIMDVKALGAKGDGVTDDTAALNGILAAAANMSSIVYFPFGVYIIKDTLKVPLGSRIIGQAWSQIMATGANFEDVNCPRVAVKVGQPGDVGIIEIQDMMFTVSGPTAGAVLLEWNVYQSSKGSAGMWDTHFRVGGAIGSKLQKADCPKGSETINKKCMAASLLMNFTPNSSVYLENIWAWVADHDLDVKSQDQINVYVGRGILLQSKLAWLYGTSSEHNVLYQYQLSGASNILMGMIQTESPYYQPLPKAPAPFPIGLFPNDPDFSTCTPSSPIGCYSSWALRVINSNTIYSLGAGLYSFFSNYTQTCLNTENCQERGVHLEESYDVWIYNLCTKAMVEMISPYKGIATLAKDNKNGFLSSILAWLQGAKNKTGKREFTGFQIYTADELDNYVFSNLTSTCKVALTQSINCDPYVTTFQNLAWRGSLNNKTLTDSVCDSSCGKSLKTYFDSVALSCAGYNMTRTLPTLMGGRIWAGYNETCLKDPGTGSYCNDLINNYTEVKTIQQMPKAEACSYCYFERYWMMQRSAYSPYNAAYRSDLLYLRLFCSRSGVSIEPQPAIDSPPPAEDNPCFSNVTYTTATNDTCDSIALAQKVSSAALFQGNKAKIFNCSSIAAGTKLCLPFSCATTYKYGNETCYGIEAQYNLPMGTVRKYNPWIALDCRNLQTATDVYGRVLCLSPQNGLSNTTLPGRNDTTIPEERNGYTQSIVLPPRNVTVARNTTRNCGRWDVANTTSTSTIPGDTCQGICLENKIPYDLFLQVNPSLPSNNCTGALLNKVAYCVGPVIDWNVTAPAATTVSETRSSTTTPIVTTTRSSSSMSTTRTA